MVSFQTESKLADLIGAIADNERQLELNRQLLADSLFYSPSGAPTPPSADITALRLALFFKTLYPLRCCVCLAFTAHLGSTTDVY